MSVDKGMEDGQKVTFSGEGDQEPGLEPGDIIIVLDEKAHALFKRNGQVACVHLYFFSASQDALEVMIVTDWLTPCSLTLLMWLVRLSDDTYGDDEEYDKDDDNDEVEEDEED